MNSTSTGNAAETTTTTSRSSSHSGTERSTGFRIYWGRTLLALTAVVALAAGVVTTVAAALTGVGWMVPAVCGGLLLASVVTLRASAVVRRRRQRRRRVEAAMQEAMGPAGGAAQDQRGAATSASASAAAGSQRRAPFDALGADETGQGGPDSLVKLDEDGLPDNPERLFTHDDDAATGTGEQQPAAVYDQSPSHGAGVGEEAWQPREVPTPKYLAAEKATRPEPEPLAAPEQPAPSPETKLKQSAASPAAAEHPALRGEHPGTTENSLDLDEVLKRRRA